MDLVGQQLDRYQIVRSLGHGSMADVYEAVDTHLDSAVAIKIIYPHLIRQPAFLDRFRREAEVIAALRHPHIVRLNEFVCRPDSAYMVMELLLGGTLEARLQRTRQARQPIAPPQLLEWVTAIASAVDFAHSLGLVHRDIKPSNLLFRQNGELMLTDFGLAYIVGQTRISHSNATTGTPAYMSPEQARGLPGDARSDVYSMGVVLYEMLVGETPFQGSTISVAMKHITEAPPSPRVFGAYLPPEVEAVVMRALSKNPVERYQSAGALAHALRQAYERAVVPPPAPRPAVTVAPASQPPARTRSTAPLPSTPPPAAPPQPAAPRAAAPRPPAPRTARRPDWRLIASSACLALVALAFAWSAVTYRGPDEDRATLPPQFGVGAQVRLEVPGGTSTSVLRGCPTGLWLGVLGIVSSGESGRVLDRRGCGGEWWYQVTVPAAANAEWDGVGWVNGQYLVPR